MRDVIGWLVVWCDTFELFSSWPRDRPVCTSRDRRRGQVNCCDTVATPARRLCAFGTNNSQYAVMLPNNYDIHSLVAAQQTIRATGVGDLLRDFAVAQRSTLHAVLVECQHAVRQTDCVGWKVDSEHSMSLSSNRWRTVMQLTDTLDGEFKVQLSNHLLALAHHTVHRDDLDAVAVTYENGVFLELRRLGFFYQMLGRIRSFFKVFG